jgi:hypothetical protein
MLKEVMDPRGDRGSLKSNNNYLTTKKVTESDKNPIEMPQFFWQL